jgi:hypothetical protein
MSDEILDPDAVSDAEWLPVRAALRDVVVPAEAREAALAAALAAFDQAPAELDDVAAAAAAAAMPASAADRQGDVVSLQTRMGARWTRWVGTAAAAVAVLAVGGVVINGLGRSSNEQVSVEPAAAVESASATDSAKVIEPTEANATDMAPMAGSVEAVSEPDPTSTISSIGGGGAVTESTPPEVVALAPTVAIADSAGLAAYATRAAAAPPMADIPYSACQPTGTDMLGVVSFQGITAIVVRNGDSSYSAIAADTCAVLATVTL